MVRTLTLLLFLIHLFCFPQGPDAQNPFRTPRDSTAPAPSQPSLHNNWLVKISLLQEQLREKTAGLIRQVKTGESPRALWIVLLGLVIFTKSSHAFLSRRKSKVMPPAQECANPNGSLALWAMAVGLVSCPGVMMVMLFCLSMNVLCWA